ncbi:MAG: DUF63 family protein [Candidatus Nanohalobium sp.]
MPLFEQLLRFVWKYFAGPIAADAMNQATATWNGTTAQTGYNVFNTAAWAAIGVTAVYMVKEKFKEIGIQLDTGTAVNTLPFVVTGGLLRFLEDAAALPFLLRPLAITPLIYLVIGLLFAAAVLAARKLEQKGYKKSKTLRYMGVAAASVTALYTLIVVPGLEIVAGLKPVAIALTLTGLYYLVSRKKAFGRKEYVLTVFSQVFGGAVSMVSLSYGYRQKQLLAQAFTALLGQPGILVFKTGLALAAVYLIEESLEEEAFKAVALIVLYSVGLGTGLRVLLRLMAGI